MQRRLHKSKNEVSALLCFKGVSSSSPDAHRQRRLHREQHRSQRMHKPGTCQQRPQGHKGALTAERSTEVQEWVGSRKK